MLFTRIKSRVFRNHLANFHLHIDPSVEMWLIVYSNDHAPLTVRPIIYSSSKLRTVQMMIFSLVAMIGLEKCCITSACLQWLCHSGERIVARGPLVISYHMIVAGYFGFMCPWICPSLWPSVVHPSIRILKWLDTLGRFSVILYRRNTFNNFLFAFLLTRPFLKRVLL